MGAFREISAVFFIALAFNTLLVLDYGGLNTLSTDGWRHLATAENIAYGRGFVIDTLWPLNEGMVDLPKPSFLDQPLYPMVLSAFMVFFGQNLTGILLISAITEAFNAALSALLAFQASKSRAAALVAGVFYMSNFSVIQLVNDAMTESLFSTFTVAAIILLMEKRTPLNCMLLGLFSGLAFLTRHYGLVIILSICVFVLLENWRSRLRQVFIIGLVSLLISMPVFYRNFILTGSPFYTSNNFFVFLPLTPVEYSATFDNPSSGDIIHRINQKTIGMAASNVILLFRAFIYPMGGYFVFLLMLVGLSGFKGYGAKIRRLFILSIILFLLALLGTATSFMQLRHVYFIIPFMSCMAAIGLDRLSRLFGGSKKILIILTTLIVLYTAYHGVYNLGSVDKTPSAYGTFWLLENNVSVGAVMANLPFYADYLLKTNAIQLPSNSRDLKPLIDRYNVTHVIYMPNHDYLRINGKEPYLNLTYTGNSGKITIFKIYAVNL